MIVRFWTRKKLELTKSSSFDVAMAEAASPRLCVVSVAHFILRNTAKFDTDAKVVVTETHQLGYNFCLCISNTSLKSSPYILL